MADFVTGAGVMGLGAVARLCDAAFHAANRDAATPSHVWGKDLTLRTNINAAWAQARAAASPVGARPGALDPLRELTPRENQVLVLLLTGLRNKQIAYELGISEPTAKAHVSAILRKLKVSSRCRVIALLSNVDGATKERLRATG